jgi:hypothetical protein
MEQKIEDGEKCNSLAAWDMVCKPKNKGGLGVLNLKIQNHGLLLKYLHKFYNKADTPWVHLIWNTYYREHIPHALPPSGSFWWKDVFNLTPIFRGVASAKIGDGTSTLFWKDLWLSQINAEKFPRAFSYVTKEDASVHEVLNASRLSENFFLPLLPEAMAELRLLQAQTVSMQLTVYP